MLANKKEFYGKKARRKAANLLLIPGSSIFLFLWPDYGTQ